MSELVNYMPGLPEQSGTKQMAPAFAQGEDLLLTIQLNRTIVPAQWSELECVVKKNVHADNVLWRVKNGAGLLVSPTEMEMTMPANVTAQFLPGTYHMSLTGRKQATTAKPLLGYSVLAEAMFNIYLSASSPNPKLLATSQSVLTEINPETGIVTLKVTGVENTVPLGADPSTTP